MSLSAGTTYGQDPHLHAAGVTVLEVNRPDRAAPRHNRHPRCGGRRPCRPCRAGHRDCEDRRRPRWRWPGCSGWPRPRRSRPAPRGVNQLTAVLVCTDPALRESLAGLGRTTLVRRCAALDAVDPTDTSTAAISFTARAYPGLHGGTPAPSTTLRPMWRAGRVSRWVYPVWAPRRGRRSGWPRAACRPGGRLRRGRRRRGSGDRRSLSAGWRGRCR